MANGSELDEVDAISTVALLIDDLSSEEGNDIFVASICSSKASAACSSVSCLDGAVAGGSGELCCFGLSSAPSGHPDAGAQDHHDESYFQGLRYQVAPRSPGVTESTSCCVSE